MQSLGRAIESASPKTSFHLWQCCTLSEIAEPVNTPNCSTEIGQPCRMKDGGAKERPIIKWHRECGSVVPLRISVGASGRKWVASAFSKAKWARLSQGWCGLYGVVFLKTRTADRNSCCKSQLCGVNFGGYRSRACSTSCSGIRDRAASVLQVNHRRQIQNISSRGRKLGFVMSGEAVFVSHRMGNAIWLKGFGASNSAHCLSV